MTLYLQIANLTLTFFLIIVVLILLKQKSKNNDIQYLVLNHFFSKNYVNGRIHYWVKLQIGYVCYVEGDWYCSDKEPGDTCPPRPPFDPRPIKPPPKQP